MQKCEENENENAFTLTITKQIKDKHEANLLKRCLRYCLQHQKCLQQKELTYAQIILRDLTIKFLGFSIAQALVLFGLTEYQYIQHRNHFYLYAFLCNTKSQKHSTNQNDNFLFVILSWFLLKSQIWQNSVFPTKTVIKKQNQFLYLPKFQYVFRILIIIALIFQSFGNRIIFFWFRQDRHNLQINCGLAVFSTFFFWITSAILSSNSKETQKVMLIVMKEKDEREAQRKQQNLANITQQGIEILEYF